MEPPEIIGRAIAKIGREFRSNPFKFFDEKDVHTRFFDLWIELGGEWDKIYREHPTEQRYKKINGKLFPDDDAKRGADIDFVIKDGQTYGIEFYLGTDTDEGRYYPSEKRDECYHLRKKAFNPEQAIVHFENDLGKLSNPKNGINRGYIICFFRHWWNKEERSEKSLEEKEKAYVENLENFLKCVRNARSDKSLTVKLVGGGPLETGVLRDKRKRIGTGIPLSIGKTMRYFEIGFLEPAPNAIRAANTNVLGFSSDEKEIITTCAEKFDNFLNEEFKRLKISSKGFGEAFRKGDVRRMRVCFERPDSKLSREIVSEYLHPDKVGMRTETLRYPLSQLGLNIGDSIVDIMFGMEISRDSIIHEIAHVVYGSFCYEWGLNYEFKDQFKRLERELLGRVNAEELKRHLRDVAYDEEEIPEELFCNAVETLSKQREGKTCLI